MAVTKYQAFTIETICRNEIKNAPYNPRVINEEAKKKLRANLKKIGLVSTLTVNKRSMNLLSGHQRISIIDSLEKKDDYMLTVSMVDLDEKQEKEQNVFLNNSNAQGEYDFDLIRDLDIDFKLAGFELDEVSFFKADAIIEKNEVNESEQQTADRINAIKAVKKSQKKKEKDGENFICLMFKEKEDKNKFLIDYGFEEEEKYLDAKTFIEIIKSKT